MTERDKRLSGSGERARLSVDFCLLCRGGGKCWVLGVGRMSRKRVLRLLGKISLQHFLHIHSSTFHSHIRHHDGLIAYDRARR